MRKATGLTVTAAAALGVLALVQTAPAEEPPAQATYRDIEQTLGSVPTFFKMFPEVGIAGAWSEFKSVQLNPKTKLDGKTKELLGLAVAAQIPCQYCIYFHTAAAKLNGASEEERDRGDGGVGAPLEHRAQRHAGRPCRLPEGNRCGAEARSRQGQVSRQVAIGAAAVFSACRA
jgi:AhpD family alkylhydroperoxidase